MASVSPPPPELPVITESDPLDSWDNEDEPATTPEDEVIISLRLAPPHNPPVGTFRIYSNHQIPNLQLCRECWWEEWNQLVSDK